MNSKESDGWGQPNMAITSDDTLWVATVKGLARLDPQRFQRTNHKPAIFMEDVDVGRTKTSPGWELILPPGTSHVEFHFTAVDLVSPEKIRLQYWLDSVDPVWLDADSTRTAIYNSIPVGAHSFHIRASNRDGVWDRGGIVYSVIHQPLLYETTWFRLSALAVIGLLVAGIYRWRVNQFNGQEKKLRDVVETIPAMTFTSSSNGLCTFVNKRWTEYTGLSVEETSGAGWQRAIHPEDLVRNSEKWRISVQPGRFSKTRRGSVVPLTGNIGGFWCVVYHFGTSMEALLNGTEPSRTLRIASVQNSSRPILPMRAGSARWENWSPPSRTNSHSPSRSQPLMPRHLCDGFSATRPN
jgi:PAS domain S-box-containing protein